MHRLVTPTVEILVNIPSDQADGTWAWATHPEHSPAGREPVFDRNDLQRVLLGYGAVMAQILRPQGPRTFRLLAHGLISGRMIGSYQLAWDARLARYEPDGDPWVIWDVFSERVVADLRAGMSTTQAIRVHYH